MARPDVLVVGGGPALATAIAASLRNLRVTLVDSRRPPIDKPCGEGLLPEAVAALHTLGIELDASLGFPFAGLQFLDEKSTASAKFSRGRALGLRRTVLQQLLIDRAIEVGVSLQWGAKISGLDSRGVCVSGDFVPCKWIVGADGQHSIIRQLAKLGPVRHHHSRFGFRRHYAIAPWTDFVEAHWGKNSQMIVTPTGAREICVSLFTSDSHVRMDRSFDRFSAVASRLRGVQPVSSEAGAVTSFGSARAVVRGNVALVGDAGCVVDAIAGQGLSLAFQQSLALADALARGDLAPYESAHRQITRVAIRMTQLLLLMNASTFVRRKVLRLFAAKPEFFANMTSIHGGESGPNALNATRVADLSWHVLWA